MDHMSKESRAQAARTRRENNLTAILDTVEKVEEKLDTISVADFAKEAGVNPRTLKNHGFADVASIVDAYLARKEADGASVSPSISKRASAVNPYDLSALQRKLDSYADLDADEQIKRTEEVYSILSHGLEAESSSVAQSHQRHALASACCYLSYRYLQRSSEGDGVVPLAQRAIHFARTGLTHVEKVHGRKHFRLAAQLARIGAAAAHQLSRYECAGLGPNPSETELLKAQKAVLVQMRTISDFKEVEKGYLQRLDLPVLYAAAEYQRARADACFHEDVDAEIQATVAFARELEELEQGNHAVHPRVLVPFLARMCCVQVAYTEKIGKLALGEEFLRLRDHLLAVLSRHHEAPVSSRALMTMFALADAREGAGAFHSADLILVCTFGVVGELLVAEHLRAVADGSKRKKNDDEDPYGAIKMHYARATEGTAVLGAAAVLADRARAALRSEIKEADDPGPWQIFSSGNLDESLVERVTLSIVTGKPPTKEQASALLRELNPLIATLNKIVNGNTIADLDAHSSENGSAEQVAIDELSFC